MSGIFKYSEHVGTGRRARRGPNAAVRNVRCASGRSDNPQVQPMLKRATEVLLKSDATAQSPGHDELLGLSRTRRDRRRIIRESSNR